MEARACMHACTLHGRGIIRVPIPGDGAGHTPEALAAQARAHGIAASTSPGVAQALAGLAQRPWPTPPRILIAGSLYLAGDVLRANGTIPE